MWHVELWSSSITYILAPYLQLPGVRVLLKNQHIADFHKGYSERPWVEIPLTVLISVFLWVLNAWLSSVNFFFIDFIESQNHRQPWVGRDLKDHSVPNPLPWVGLPAIISGRQGPIQPVLEHLQEWGRYKPYLWRIWFWFWSLVYHIPLTHMHAPLPLPQHALSLSGEASLLNQCSKQQQQMDSWVKTFVSWLLFLIFLLPLKTQACK